MPLVCPLPPRDFYANRRFVASAFDIDIMKAWAKRTASAGHTFWLHRGRLVSQHAISVLGVQSAWEHAEKPAVAIDLTKQPPVIGPIEILEV